MANKKVLLVDNDSKIVELVKFYLVGDGYTILTAYNGIEALRIAREAKPDLIVLDVELSGGDGLNICHTLRAESTVSIILLATRTTDQNSITGLDSGVDDYITKPFSPKELAARVRTVIRRISEETLQTGPEELRFGNLRIDSLNHVAYLNCKALSLTPIEFKLLGVFIREPNRVFSRTKLVEKVLGFNYDGFDRSMDVHILNLRRKIESCPSQPKYIKTIYGVGYKLTEGIE
jgi:two-component system, OmpR family, alkaline phosphatase synthesis response regulator PhoP